VPVVTTERSRTESGVMDLNLVRQAGATKALVVQIRPAMPGPGMAWLRTQVGQLKFISYGCNIAHHR